MLTCEACKSENIQKLSLVYEAGLSNIQGKQSGIGFGVGGGGGTAGVGTSKITGTNQTVMSKNAEPPTKKKPIKVGFFYLLGAWLVYQFAPGNLSIGIILILAGGFHAFSIIRYNRQVYPSLFKKWNDSFLCMKCGTVSLPVKNTASPSSE